MSENYHQLKSLGSTDIKSILKNALLWKIKKENKTNIEGLALDIGTYLHAQILEPHTILSKFALSGEFEIHKKDKSGLSNKQKFDQLINSEKKIGSWTSECLTKDGKLGKTKKAIAAQANVKSLTPADFYLNPETFTYFEFYRDNQDKIFISNKSHDLVKMMVIELYKLDNFREFIKQRFKN